MIKQSFKKDKAITLVALIITMIVLLILAIVSIRLIMNGGIINRFDEAKEQHKISSEIELISLSVQESYIEENLGEISKEKLNSNLEKYIGKNKAIIYSNEDEIIVKITDNNSRFYKIDKNNKVIFIGYHVDIEDSSNNMEIGDNIFNLENLTKNTYIDSANGNTTSSSAGWNTSDFIAVSEYSTYAIVSDNGDFLSHNNNATYDANKNFIRPIYITKGTVNNEIIGDVKASIQILKFNNNEKYLRISAEASTLNHIKIFPLKSEQINLKLQFNVLNNLMENYTIDDNNLYNKNIIGSSYISDSNGAQIPYDSSWESTDYIDVGNNDKIAVCTNNLNVVLNQYSGMYDANKNYIKRINNYGNTKYNSKIGNYKILEIPSNVKYIRFSAQAGYLSSLQIYPIITIQEDLSDNFKLSNLKVEENILNPDDFIKNKYIETDGRVTQWNGWDATDFIELNSKNGVFIKNQTDKYNAFYDESKKIVDSINFSSNDYIHNSKLGKVGIELKYINVYSNAKYYRLSNLTEKLRNVRIFPVKNDDFNGYVNFNMEE